MSHTVSTTSSIRRLRRQVIATAALAGLLVAVSGEAASANLSSPDARASYVARHDVGSPVARTTVVAGQDLRSPDARVAVVAAQPAPKSLLSPDAVDSTRVVAQSPAQDLRSPDARGTGQFVSTTQQPQAQPQPTNGGFDWIYLAIGVALSLMIGASVLLLQRRRHDAMPIGG